MHAMAAYGLAQTQLMIQYDEARTERLAREARWLREAREARRATGTGGSGLVDRVVERLSRFLDAVWAVDGADAAPSDVQVPKLRDYPSVR